MGSSEIRIIKEGDTVRTIINGNADDLILSLATSIQNDKNLEFLLSRALALVNLTNPNLN